MLTLLFIIFSLLLLPSPSMSFLISSIILTSLISILNIYSYSFSYFISSFIIIDSISSTLISLTLWVTALIILARKQTFSTQNQYYLFSSLIIILALLLMSAFSASNLFLFYILFEGSLIPTLLLIIG